MCTNKKFPQITLGALCRCISIFMLVLSISCSGTGTTVQRENEEEEIDPFETSDITLAVTANADGTTLFDIPLEVFSLTDCDDLAETAIMVMMDNTVVASEDLDALCSDDGIAYTFDANAASPLSDQTEPVYEIVLLDSYGDYHFYTFDPENSGEVSESRQAQAVYVFYTAENVSTNTSGYVTTSTLSYQVSLTRGYGMYLCTSGEYCAAGDTVHQYVIRPLTTETYSLERSEEEYDNPADTRPAYIRETTSKRYVTQTSYHEILPYDASVSRVIATAPGGRLIFDNTQEASVDFLEDTAFYVSSTMHNWPANISSEDDLVDDEGQAKLSFTASYDLFEESCTQSCTTDAEDEEVCTTSCDADITNESTTDHIDFMYALFDLDADYFNGPYYGVTTEANEPVDVSDTTLYTLINKRTELDSYLGNFDDSLIDGSESVSGSLIITGDQRLLVSVPDGTQTAEELLDALKETVTSEISDNEIDTLDAQVSEDLADSSDITDWANGF